MKSNSARRRDMLDLLQARRVILADEVSHSVIGVVKKHGVSSVDSRSVLV